MASEVFNNEVTRINELFFTSRKAVIDQKAASSEQPKKTISSSPLPKDESSSDEEGEEPDQEGSDQKGGNKENAQEEPVEEDVVMEEPSTTKEDDAVDVEMNNESKDQEEVKGDQGLTKEQEATEPLNNDIEPQIKEEIV